jgi:hypothetical protein
VSKAGRKAEGKAVGKVVSESSVFSHLLADSYSLRPSMILSASLA